MKEVKFNGHRVSIYNSIEDLPIKRFHKYNKCLLVDSGVGSDLSSFDAHIEKVVRYIKSDNREEAAKEMENLRQNIYMMMQGLNPQHMAFACLVHSIDGKVYDDLSDDGIIKVLELLGGTPTKEVTTYIEEVKKKIDVELSLYYPKIFDDARTKEYYDIMKARAKAMLDCVLDGDTDENKRRIEELTDRLLLFNKPQTFTGSESVEIAYDKNFDSMCLTISENLHTEAKKMTVMEFYNAYQYISKQAKSRMTQNGGRRQRFATPIGNH